MKAPRHKLYGLLIPLDLLARAWESISLNFITGLPPSGRRGKAYNVILIIICRYSKILRYIACTTKIDVPELAERLYEKIVFKLGMLVLMISDKERVFISKW
jgi:hypothetical protein